jgi:hypothetical protein
MKKPLALVLSAALGATPALAQQSAAGPQEAQQTPQQAPQQGFASGPRFILEDGTPIKLVLSQNVSSADANVGDTVSFEVVEDVLVDGIVVVPKGSIAWATVTAAQHKKTMGRGGKLDMNIDKVRLADGSKTLLSATKNAKGGGHTGAMTGAIVATSLILWPAAPFFLLIHGKDITIPKGTAITAFIQGDDVLDRAKFVAPSALSAQAPSARQATSATAPAQPGTDAQAGMQSQSTDSQPSLGEVARQNRARKAAQGQAQAQTDTPDKPQN